MTGAASDPRAARTPEGRGRPRDPRALLLIAALALLGMASGLGLLLAVRRGAVPELDSEWMDEVSEHRGAPWVGVALAFDWLGGGIVATAVIPLLVLTLLLALRRWWASLFWAASVALSAGLVQAIKHLVDRTRPDEILVTADRGSFPSGHTANAATIAVVLAVVLWRWWVTVLGTAYTATMALSRTYLGAHWLTDTVGGILVGIGVGLFVWGMLAARLARRERARPPALVALRPLPAPGEAGGKGRS